jgi:hypothetical protein
LDKVDFTTKIRSHLRSDHPELVGKFDEICSEFDQEKKSEFHMKSIDSLESVNDKGQLISKCSTYKKTMIFFSKRISALTSKKRTNKKSP